MTAELLEPTGTPKEEATVVPRSHGAAARPTGQPLPTPTHTGGSISLLTPSVTPPSATLEPTRVPETLSRPDLSGKKVSLRTVASGLQQPLFAAHAGDGSGRLFVAEKAGVIRVLRDGLLLERPFLDLRDRVKSGGSEQGLLGLAFDPNYARSGLFWVNYTGADGETVLARFRVSPEADLADPASEVVILTIDQPAANHNGGMIAFGPDGMLYVGMGDGGASNDRFENGQNPDTLLGKMLRLEVTGDPGDRYSIPADNPWIRSDWKGRETRDEIWAVGLRNPWRFSFDRSTGDLWIADVGQNEYEEVNLVRAGTPGGLNFGWPITEGVHCFRQDSCDRAGLELPVHEYGHGENGCSVTGGYVYRGSAFPALAGAYLFGDYCSGRIWGLTEREGGWEVVLLADTGLTVSSFGEDEAGELYVTDLSQGVILRLEQTQ
jgi:glucose/arabinose dehydrogenase